MNDIFRDHDSILYSYILSRAYKPLSGSVRVPIHLLPKNILRSGFPPSLRAVLLDYRFKVMVVPGWYVYISRDILFRIPVQKLTKRSSSVWSYLDHDPASIHEIDNPRSFCDDLCLGIRTKAPSQTGFYNPGLRLDDRHSSTHHVRPHQGTVGIVMFQEQESKKRR